MPDKKLTDTEIIKALECCAKSDCNKCEYFGKNNFCIAVNIPAVIDLINRLQAENERKDKVFIETLRRCALKDKIITEKTAEIERLKKENHWFADIGKLYSEIKAEAYKEFAERLKMRAINRYNEYDNQEFPYATITHIDNLLKELVGEGGGNK